MIEFTAHGIGVDAGMIVITDQKDMDGSKGYICPIKNGNYKVKWRIVNTWNGEIHGTGIVYITTGYIMVVDPCYVIDNSVWHSVLEQTNYFKSPPPGWVVIDSMGGDGCYDVTVKLKLIEHI